MAHIAIHDGGDICQWLRLSPEVVRSFPQLLSLRDLQELLRDAVHSDVIIRSQTAIALAQTYARVFVPTAAYHSAREKLVEYGFVILEGPPEMGKTTIGRIIALSQIIFDWEAIECRSPTDVLKMYRRDRRQVFVADDFFGRTEYEPMRVSEWQSELAHILPLLGRTHWLVLTCRAHLLEMAKANLDIAGQNSRFPALGEVVVNAGDLKPGEKARILYRNAKAVGLGSAAKKIVKEHAPLIVTHRHFTPERIRRLVEELVPDIALETNLSEEDVKARLSEALTNPTKQMRVSFRKLPGSHRWLMFALLETDQARLFSGLGLSELQDRYDTLCPPAIHQPYKRVVDELTEGFIKKTPGFFSDQIDWIHPSCRDLAIDELAEHPRDRERFFEGCSKAGLRLATSLAGGSKGQRQLPFLQTEEDWQSFTRRAEQLVEENPGTIRVVWTNYQALLVQRKQDLSLASAVSRLGKIIKDKLIPPVGKRLGDFGYSDCNSLSAFFEICRDMQSSPEIDLTGAWADCHEDVKDWADHQDDVIWEDDRVPKRLAEFLAVLEAFVPSFLKKPEIREQLQEMHDLVVMRAEEESNSNYSSPNGDDEIATRANGFESLQKNFKKLAAVSIWSEQQQQSLDGCASHFSSEAEALREDLPWEPDEDYSGSIRSASGPISVDVNISDLFRDL